MQSTGEFLTSRGKPKLYIKSLLRLGYHLVLRNFLQDYLSLKNFLRKKIKNKSLILYGRSLGQFKVPSYTCYTFN